jgi:hypothetical protein
MGPAKQNTRKTGKLELSAANEATHRPRPARTHATPLSESPVSPTCGYVPDEVSIGQLPECERRLANTGDPKLGFKPRLASVSHVASHHNVVPLASFNQQDEGPKQ